LIWGFSFYFIKVGPREFTPVGVAFSRIVFGAVTLIMLSLVTKNPLPPRWSWKYIFFTSLLWVSIPWMLLDSVKPECHPQLPELLTGQHL